MKDEDQVKIGSEEVKQALEVTPKYHGVETVWVSDDVVVTEAYADHQPYVAPAPGSSQWMANLQGEIMARQSRMREEGQKEYARSDDNVFANFERLSTLLDIPREKILLVFAFKHLEGILSHLDGHTSQREDVTGRFTDLHVYLNLLEGMVEQNRSE